MLRWLFVVSLFLHSCPRSSGVARVVPILHAWHYDDLMRDSVHPPPSVLVFYASSWCQAAFNEFGVNAGAGLPTRGHLFVGTYDVDRFRDVWWEGESRLEERYHVTRLPSVVFLPNPRDAPHDFEVWEWSEGGRGHWREWLWQKLAFTVEVTNRHAAAVDAVVLPRRGAAAPPAHARVLQPPRRLAAGDTASLPAVPGAAFAATDLAGALVTAVAELARPPEAAACATPLVVGGAPHEAHSPRDIADLDDVLNAKDQDTTYTHAGLLRQPPAMPDNDVSSYLVLDMPEELRRTVDAFYDKHRHVRTVEEFNGRTTAINQHVVNTTMVSFDREPREKARISEQLVQPLVEAWARTELVHTAFYGIREYHRGAELRMHIDKCRTHVYSVIINVRQEGVEADWPLELIDFDGRRTSVVMRPGQLLFYQSAKLVHGRPSAFNGTLYANCFCHFAPAAGWDYAMGAGDFLYHEGRPIVDYKVFENR